MVSAEMHFFIWARCPPCRSVHFIGVLPLAEFGYLWNADLAMVGVAY